MGALAAFMMTDEFLNILGAGCRCIAQRERIHAIWQLTLLEFVLEAVSLFPIPHLSLADVSEPP